MASRPKRLPDAEQAAREIPDASVKTVPVPDATAEIKELPQVGSAENTVVIGGQLVEIKPMKLKYIRNRTAAFRHILEMYPLSDILAMDGKFGDGRDGDKALMDWLIAVTDNEELICKNYDEIDSGTVYQMLAIHRRIEHIDEQEKNLKNAETPREG